MKRDEREAIAVVRSAANRAFNSRVIRERNANPAWEPMWMRVRLRCRECEDGYYVRYYRGKYTHARCTSCEHNLDSKEFWQQKALVVMGLVHPEEDLGPLPAYLMVEPRVKAPA